MKKSTLIYKIIPILFLGLSLAVSGCAANADNKAPTGDQEIHWQDKGLEAMIREYLNQPSGPIYSADVAGIEHLHIVELSIQHREESDKDFLVRLEEARKAEQQTTDTTKRPIYNLNDLAHFTGLTQLILEKGRAEKIDALSGLTNLTVLRLENYLVTDISPLSHLKYLTQLSLRSNHAKLASLEPLSSLVNLRELDLGGGCSFASSQPLAPLATLKGLIKLDLSNSKTDDLSPLKDLTGLTALDLSNAVPAGGLSPVSALINLNHLTLAGDNISDLSPLTHLQNLKSLQVTHAKVKDISSLSSLTQLEYLDLRNNQIRDISPLSGLTGLDTILLDENKIIDSTPLAGLTNTSVVSLSGNPIKK